MPVMVKSRGVSRLPFSATYFKEKSWRSSAVSMAMTPSTAPATINHVYRRPTSRRAWSRRRNPLGRRPRRAAADVPLDAEALVPQLRTLGHGLVRRAEVERGVAQAPEHEEPQGGDDDEPGDQQSAAALGAAGRALLG